MSAVGAATVARLGADEVAALEALLWLVESVAGVCPDPPIIPAPAAPNTDVLTAYQLYPMQDGDVVLLIEEAHVATEIAGLANHWDQVLRRNLAYVVREIGARGVQLGIARRDCLRAREQ